MASDGHIFFGRPISDGYAVLEGAGLITKERRGRERFVHTEVDTVQRARVLLDGIEELWRARVDRIDDLLATEKRTTGGKR